MSAPVSPCRLPPKLLVLSPGDLRAERFDVWLSAVGRCVEQGLAGVLLREPDMSDRLRLYLALQLAKVLKPGGGFLALHDAPHLAAAAGVDGVHLGFRSLPVSEVQRWAQVGLTVGLSTHLGDALGGQGADYCFYGPVFETPSKVGLKDPVGLDDLRVRCAASSVPIWALGGIVPDNAERVLQCGVAGLAVRAAVWDSKKPWKQIARFASAMGGQLD